MPNDITPNLTRVYYRKIVRLMADENKGALAVAQNGGDSPIAFCSVVYRPHEFSALIGAEPVELAKSLASFAVTKPWLLVDLGAAIFGKSTWYEPEVECPEIYVICVADGHRSKGIGRALIDACVAHLRVRGDKALVVKTADPGAEHFYAREGFRKVGEQSRIRRKLAIMRLDL